VTESPAHSIARQYATFVVGGHYLGIDVLGVQEVLRQQRLTRVPLAPDVVEGLINLRGQIVPALDMRRLLHLPSRDPAITPLSVVVRTEHGAVSLQVDEIGDVVDLDAASFERPPRNVEPALARLLLGVHKLRERLLLILDTRCTVDVAAYEEGQTNQRTSSKVSKHTEE
jgi:purine-binding chemotaxis protein CheW